MLLVFYKGFLLFVWGIVGIEKEDIKEIDFILGYVIGGFSIFVIDYWFNGGLGYFYYGLYNINYIFEV